MITNINNIMKFINTYFFGKVQIEMLIFKIIEDFIKNNNENEK